MQQSFPGPDAAEYARRLTRVQEGMAERSFAALLVTDPANMYYLTGYNAWSFYTPQCLVVPASGPPVLFARAMDAAGAGFTAWLPPEQIEGYPEELVHRPKVHPYDWIAERIRERGLIETGQDGCVGIEGDSAFFTARGYLALRAGLPHVRLEDSQELVNWVRVVKSDHELAQMRIAGSIAQQVMEVALAAVAPGRRQCDVVAEIAAAQARGTAEHGGDYPALVPMLPTGKGAGTPHLTWTEEEFRVGEATTIELAGVYRRYHAPLARTIMLGEPPRRLADTAAIVRDGMAEVLATLRPGRTAHEIHAAWNAVISAHGLTKESRIGYSIGLGYPPDWGERTISLRPDEHTVLEAGMCFHVILGMWMDDWGYELSEPVALTTDGVERLTDLTQNLTIGR
ncbi:M24 family metallopeptidase [Nonomuraea guangzhouensis]|uniref:M24 family metallopeptidase n=1 Tax=Nonomuraea guangzhouensis TaxID=1291555 RepID=A0ABW4G801_9ACTN|nr:M24 family metallopeptidase [Nonomuraea guangzhouensis]